MAELNQSTKQTGLSAQQRELLAYLLAEEGIELEQVSKISPREISDTTPVSFPQARLWFLDQLQPGSYAYNIPVALSVAGHLNVTALAQSLNEIVRRHEALRTTFTTVNQQPVQVIHSAQTLTVPVIDLEEFSESDRQTQYLRLADQEAKQPFDLSQFPLLRAKVLRLSDEEHIVLLTMHHIISDGWSLGVLVQELATFYDAFSNHQPVPLSPLSIQYADYAVWQQQRLQGDLLDTQLNYWKQQLAGSLPVLQLPTDRPRPAVQTFCGARQKLQLPKSLSKAILDLSQQAGVTPFITLLTAFKILLYRYTGQADMIVGSPVANRNQAETEDLIGFFINTVVLRTNLGGNPSFQELLSSVRDVVLEAYNHQELPFEKLVETLRPERDMSHTPLFQVMFALQNTPMSALEFSGLQLIPLEIDNGTAKFDLTLDLEETLSGIKGWLEYNRDLFDASTIERMAGHFQTLLEGIVTNPEQDLSDLPLLTPAEQHQLLIQWNDTQAEYPNEACIHQLFEAQVERTPNAVAVVFAEEQLSYQELNRRANQLAYYLQKLGVAPEVQVGICVERSLEMVVGLIGILKAGGAYVPLDPDYPQERLAFMLEDAQVSVLLTQKHLTERLPHQQARVVYLDSNWTTIALESTDSPNSGVTSDNSAYVIYTSGSTGLPKGPINTHRGICNRLLWMQDAYQLTAADRVLQKTPFSFDVSVWEFFWTLLTGACLILAQPGGHRDSAYLVKLIAKQKITTLHFVPSMLHIFLEEQSLETCSCLRQVMCSGEALPLDLEERFFNRLRGVKLHNLYGPTEAAIDVTFWECQQDSDRGTVPIGHPISNTQIYILDSDIQPVAIGVSGELHIAGVGLARGYHNRPDLTAEKFIPNPYPSANSNKVGTRLYKTGDLARYKPDGTIEFLGRIDYQVKIRGFRIELGEIETVLSQHPAVQATVVTVREDIAGDKRLVAYLVVKQESAPTVNELRNFLMEKLPDYMVSSAFVFLDTMPLTPSGKVDRRALPTPEDFRPDVEAEYVAPRTIVEEALAGIWSEVLKIEQVGIHDNFFELGGHSLLATQVISRLRQSFQVELPLRSLFEAPTVASLAESLEKLGRLKQGIQDLPILPVLRDGHLPLSFAQTRLWLLEQLQPGNSAYNMSAAVRLKGQINIAALEHSFNEIVRRHEALRTTFVVVDGRPVQVIAPTLTLTLPIIELREVAETEREGEVIRLATEEEQRPFDLERGSLLRTTLLRLGEAESVLLLVMHHIILDGWSINVFVRELAALYTAFSIGNPSPLADLPIQYADFAHWEQQWLQDDVLQAHLSYWNRQLGGTLPVLELPTDKPRATVQHFRGAKRSLVLSKSLSQALKTLSQREGVTLFMTLLAAFKTLLYRCIKQEDIIVGSPIAGRNNAEIESLIGFFVNTLVLRTDLSGNPTFRELLRRVREVALGAYAHQSMPFEKLVDELQPERDLSRNPLFQVFFNMLNFASEPIVLPGLTVEILSPAEVEVGSKFDITLYAKEQNEGIQLELVYNTELFEPARMVEMLEQLQYLLSQIVENSEERIANFSLVTPTAAVLLPNPVQPLRCEWEGTVYNQLCLQANRVPESLALVNEQEGWSYRELNALSNQLANYLLASGIQSQEIVAIYGHRSASLVWALLGVLKAGAAFVILDSTYPASRLINCLHVTKPRMWLQLETAEKVPDTLEEFVAKSCCYRLQLPQSGISAVRDLLIGYSMDDPGVSVDPDDLAYVAFTSGSTGMPKGILGTHRPLSHFLHWQRQTFGLHESDRFSMLSGVSHDPLLRDIFAPLCLGATLCIPDPEEIVNPSYLAKWTKQQQISIAHLTPAIGQLLTETTPDYTTASNDNATFPYLRYVFFGGDVLTKRHISNIRKLAPSVTCVNFYGTTETPQAMGYLIVPNQGDVDSDNDPASLKEILPLGRGIQDVQLLVLNASQQLAGVSEVGEIYVRTPYLSRGYMSDDVLTKSRFITNQFTQITTDQLYKTGDLGRYLLDGNLEFLGRIDDQVKIRGFRIELGEIEAMLSLHPAVREVVVIDREDKPGDKRLVAYVVSHQKLVLTISDLRNLLKQKLPDYMVPSAFVLLDALPVTPNGKIDRRALPEPDGLRLELEVAYVPPQNKVEQIIANIWQEVLRLETVGVHDNFFDLGGNSLLIVQVLSKLREVFNMDIPMVDVYKCPTINALAKYLNQKQIEPPSFQHIHDRAETRKKSINLQKQFRQEYRATKNHRGVQDD
ncbi:MAG: amino acid adenylation domain-containing protein [Nostoc sp. NMS7]|uniref:non-ribosomal peptide synthetase n=1 Tax=Nostoc sp. NMS7 TaxID=2815391 RepID=UPI0025F927B8|nr:non-ribosomal peptide synthetase [Nostoc sp. NMS7]MBN3950378.1 amino acid adenylation domain-containing protein [Nostoc sp. NMS7]